MRDARACGSQPSLRGRSSSVTTNRLAGNRKRCNRSTPPTVHAPVESGRGAEFWAPLAIAGAYKSAD